MDRILFVLGVSLVGCIFGEIESTTDSQMPGNFRKNSSSEEYTSTSDSMHYSPTPAPPNTVVTATMTTISSNDSAPNPNESTNDSLLTSNTTSPSLSGISYDIKPLRTNPYSETMAHVSTIELDKNDNGTMRTTGIIAEDQFGSEFTGTDRPVDETTFIYDSIGTIEERSFTDFQPVSENTNLPEELTERTIHQTMGAPEEDSTESTNASHNETEGDVGFQGNFSTRTPFHGIDASMDAIENYMNQTNTYTNVTDASMDQLNAYMEITNVSTDETNIYTNVTDASMDQLNTYMEITNVSTDETNTYTNETDASMDHSNTYMETTTVSTDETNTYMEIADVSTDETNTYMEITDAYTGTNVQSSDENPTTIDDLTDLSSSASTKATSTTETTVTSTTDPETGRKSEERNCETPSEDSGSGLSVWLPIVIILIVVACASSGAAYFYFFKRKTKPDRINSYCNYEMVPIDENLPNSIVDVKGFKNYFYNMNGDFDFDSTKSRLQLQYEELAANSPTVVRTHVEPFLAANHPQNKKKNRYADIIPFDYSRVVLSKEALADTNDYINACFIPGETSKTEYIAAQGPKDETVRDFCKMIVEQRVCVVVMLTQIIERGKEKCSMYWPERAGGHIIFEDILVHMHSEVELPEYIIRELSFTLNNVRHDVTQMHFSAWPDHGCPQYPDVLHRFVEDIRGACKHRVRGPILVHCSAGVGRTGTYIAMDRLMRQVKRCGQVDVYNTTLDMRRNRPLMIQTLSQYQYLHEALDSYIDAQNEHRRSQTKGYVEVSL